MQRKHIRATVGSGDIDIPITNFVDGEFVFFSGGQLFTEVAVQRVGVPTAGNLARWFDDKTIEDSGIALGVLVRRSGTPPSQTIAVWTNTLNFLTYDTVTLNSGNFNNVNGINGRDPDDFVTGQNGGVLDGGMVMWNGTSGKAITSAGPLASDVVVKSGGHSANQVATWVGSTGRTLQAASVTISGGAIASVTTINSRNVDDFVVGPASSTNDRIASFNGATGKLIKDSGVLATNVNFSTGNIATNSLVAGAAGTRQLVDTGISYTNVVTSAAVGATNSIARYTGANRAIQSSTATIDGSGNITGVGSINSVFIDAHASRHCPNGGDSIFGDGVAYTWNRQDVACYHDAGNRFFPRNFWAQICSSASAGTTATSPGSSTITVSSRSGISYLIEWNFHLGIPDTTGNLEIAVSASSGFNRAIVSAGGNGGIIASSGGNVSFSLTTSPANIVVSVFLTLISASSNATASITFRKSAGSAITVSAGGMARAIEANFTP